MIWKEIAAIDSTPCKLRQFALVLAVACIVIGTLGLWRHGQGYTPWFVAATALALVALIDAMTGLRVSYVLWPFHKIWMGAAMLIGHVMSYVVLGLLFFLVFTLIRCVSTLLRHELLDTKWDTSPASYWIVRNGKPDPKHCEKQF